MPRSSETVKLTQAMSVVASEVQGVIKAGQDVGLTKEAAALAGVVGVLSYLRVNSLHEDVFINEAKKAVPVLHQAEFIHSELSMPRAPMVAVPSIQKHRRLR